MNHKGVQSATADRVGFIFQLPVGEVTATLPTRRVPVTLRSPIKLLEVSIQKPDEETEVIVSAGRHLIQIISNPLGHKLIPWGVVCKRNGKVRGIAITAWKTEHGIDIPALIFGNGR